MQAYRDIDERLNVAIVGNPYTGNSFLGREFSEGPKALASGGLRDRLSDLGCTVKAASIVQLTAEEDATRGNWNKLGYSLAHLGRLVADNQQKSYFTIGLLANCPSSIGMLAGLQQSQGAKPLRVGLVWIDAHGDFNTPESSRNGLLGGMPVAIAAGHCLTRLRLRAGLDPALPTRYIVMAGVREVHPFEQERIDRSDLELLPCEDIINVSDDIHRQMERLSTLTDVIYVHVDADVLNPEEIPGFNFPVPGGPTSEQLAAALAVIFRYEKTAAIGIASTPYKNDNDGVALNAAYRLIEGAINGLKARVS